MIDRSFACVLGAVAAFTFAGCGDDTGGTSSGGGSTPQDGVTWSGIIKQAVFLNPIVDASVCAVEPDVGCVTTDGDGRYTMENLPKNTPVKFKVTKEGFVSALVVFEVRDVDRDDVGGQLFANDLYAAVYADAGSAPDPTKGAIGAALFDPAVDHGASGYVASLSPAAGEGPLYSEGTTVDPSLTETTDLGGVAFANVPPGEYVFTVTGPGPCTSPDVKANGPGVWPASVEPGFLTYLIGECPDGEGSGSGGGGGSGAGGAGGAGGG